MKLIEDINKVIKSNCYIQNKTELLGTLQNISKLEIEEPRGYTLGAQNGGKRINYNRGNKN